MKLTADLIVRAVELKKQHLPVHSVASMLGISRDTWYRWMREGEKARSGLRREFYVRLHQAQAEEQLELLEHVHRSAAKGTLGAATWLLERQYPKDWGRQDQPQSDTDADGPFEVVLRIPDEAVIRPHAMAGADKTRAK